MTKKKSYRQYSPEFKRVIRRLYVDSGGVYGSPRIRADSSKVLPEMCREIHETETGNVTLDQPGLDPVLSCICYRVYVQNVQFPDAHHLLQPPSQRALPVLHCPAIRNR